MNQLAEPFLTYNQHTGRWFGENEHFAVWMSDATFRAYVAVWLNDPRWRPDLLPAEWQAQATAHCQRVAYWNGCERNYDRNVHIVYH